ncbi:hypothetical protein M409DRAFT_31073 [Zasmidium cellare ATCC 36951]|uniref:C2H2-type domain-containing protein n=1 Tax=Zasmidium cellare ATCC 36951 TaxID=1080233 RepID=A0A6A6BXZ5_ZASCE|nr:uncharacterized protein M409DRAFT_31073 [Zasmidium cellare ATCC 36951]KAF2158409.1 hypothetical protein M409DRAFT_31073 [Zasmidium cellare ATCC 36951]
MSPSTAADTPIQTIAEKHHPGPQTLMAQKGGGPPSDRLRTSDHPSNCFPTTLSSPDYAAPGYRSRYSVQHQIAPQYHGQAMAWYGFPELARRNQQHTGNVFSPATFRDTATGRLCVQTRWPQSTKRPRKRFGEVERLYKCIWDGCDKSYGTLGHLNAHVVMKSHGLKRSPAEFKEIREKKKAAENKGKTQMAAKSDHDTSLARGTYVQPQMMHLGGGSRPSIAYHAANGQSPLQYAQPQPVNCTQQHDVRGYGESPYGHGGPPYRQGVDTLCCPAK